MRRPKNDTEKAARQEWMTGGAAKAMESLRAAGYDQAAREDFLRKVVGVTERGMEGLELHRDWYLDWRKEAGL